MNRTITLNRYLVAVASLGLAVVFCLSIAQAQTEGAAAEFTATMASAGSPEGGVRINILRWSTDAERTRLADAIDTPVQVPVPEAAPAGGRGGRGRGGRGGAPPEPVDPVAEAIAQTPTLGYIWTNSIVGYSIKYAHMEPLPGGGERIVLATTRRLGPQMPAEEELALTEIRLDANGMGEARTAVMSQAATDSEARTIALSGYDTIPPILQNVRR